MLTDVIIFVNEVPFISRHYINVDEVSWITLKKLLQSAPHFVTNCDSLVYYKVTVITTCGSFFIKGRHGLLQIATGITKCDGYYKLRQYNLYLTILFYAHIRKKDIQNAYIEEGWYLTQVAPAFLQSGVSWLCTTVLSLFLSSDLFNFSLIKHHFKLWCCG